MPARHESGIGPGPRNRLRRFGRRKRPKLEARHAPQRTSVAFFGLLGGGRKRKETPDKCLLPEFRALFGVLFFFVFPGKRCIAGLFEALGLLLRDLTGERAGATELELEWIALRCVFWFSGRIVE